MRRKYPYLQDSYFQQTINEEEEKRSILEDIQNFVNQRQYIKMTLLDWQERPIKDIEGEISSGSITKNGSSPVRRSANLSCAVDAHSYDPASLQSDFSINKKIFIEIGILNETDKYPDYPIFWFPEGVFFISSFSINASSGSSTNISLTLKDKMAMLNGEIGGTFPAMVTFDSMDTQLPDGSYATKKVLIYNIIKEMVNHYGSEDLNNIVIEDVPLRIRRVMRWNGTVPLYRVGTPEIAQLDEKDTSNCYFTLQKPSEEDGWIKFNPGDDIGYIRDDFVITGELVGNAGETVTSILDKIKNTLGNYEYFYDVFGIFHFREIKNYLNTTQGKVVLADMSEKDYLIEINNERSIFTFSDETILTSITSTPMYENIKNDFIVQGTQEDSNGAKREVRYHLAVDTKPRYIGFDTRSKVNTVVDHTKDIEDAQEDIKFLQQLLNYYQSQRDSVNTKRKMYQSQIDQRMVQLKRWGDELKRSIQESLEEYAIPANQIIPGKTLTPKNPEKYSTIKVDNKEEVVCPDFYDLDFASSLIPKTSDENFNIGLSDYFKEFNHDTSFKTIIYNNLTPEGYWKILSNKNYSINSIDHIRDNWKTLVFNWSFGVWKIFNDVDDWDYTDDDTITTNEHDIIKRPYGLLDSLVFNLLIPSYEQEEAKATKNKKVVTKTQLYNTFLSIYKNNTEGFEENFRIYWSSNYNIELYDDSEFLSTLTLENLCTDSARYMVNVPKIYLRYDGYIWNSGDYSNYEQEYYREIEYSTGIAQQLKSILDNWSGSKNGTWTDGNGNSLGEVQTFHCNGTYTEKASQTPGEKWNHDYVAITKDDFTYLEGEYSFYINQADKYQKLLDKETEKSIDNISKALSDLVLKRKYEELNKYYSYYQDEIKKILAYKKKIEELEKNEYDLLAYKELPKEGKFEYKREEVLDNTFKIIKGLKTSQITCKKSGFSEKIIGRYIDDFAINSLTDSGKVKAIEWLTSSINFLSEVVNYWLYAFELELTDNPRPGAKYYSFYDDRKMILYVDPNTGRIRAGFAYNPSDDSNNLEKLPFPGNFNLVYEDENNEFYKWNGNGYSKLQVKGVYSGENPKDPSAYLAYDWRTALYLAGEYAHVFGTDTGYYYPELAAFWNQVYDLINQRFYDIDETENEHTAQRFTNGCYFLDFLDSIDTTFGEYSVSNIGRRTDVVISDEVNCLFQPEIPNVNLLDGSRSNKASEEIYDTNMEVPDSLKYLEKIYWDEENNESMLKGKDRQYYLRAESVYEHEPYLQVESELYNEFVTGGYSNGAYDQIKYELFLHTRYQNSISLTAIPVFYLEPNSRITIMDKTTNTYGDYIIQNISITFGPGANMSISCNETLERF